jgi:hypothetical protein
MQVGNELTNYPNIDFIEAKSADEVKGLLSQIRMPYHIISMYSVGGLHYVWLSVSRPIKKVIEKKKSEETLNHDKE